MVVELAWNGIHRPIVGQMVIEVAYGPYEEPPVTGRVNGPAVLMC